MTIIEMNITTKREEFVYIYIWQKHYVIFMIQSRCAEMRLLR